MKNGNVTPDDAAKLPKGNLDASWKRFYTVLGQFNTLIVLQADEDLPYATENLIKLTCLLDDRCEQEHGPGWVWDVKGQKCIYAPIE